MTANTEFFDIDLQPFGKKVKVKSGTLLRDLLFDYGVEFPCGGRGRCKGCKVRVLAGELDADSEQKQILTHPEINEGWRLACKSRVSGPLTLQIEQWEATILTDETTFHFEPGDGLGVAVDLGTTTLVAQLLDLHTAQVLAVQSALNPQARYGADLMSRIQFAGSPDGQNKLQELIRAEIGRMIEQLKMIHPGEIPVKEVVVVGNTAMHNLFCGIDVAALSQFPFEPIDQGLQLFRARDLGWSAIPEATVRFLPAMGSFVGSDILAGILATQLHSSEDLVGLLDLGTNGEIVLGNKERIVFASTAAGPAFEGARISGGMRAITGAISGVKISNNRMQCEIIGNTKARGICGSGLVDAVAAGLELGVIDATGRINHDSDVFTICPPVSLTQRDIRELQLAKGAIAAGINILLQKLNATCNAVKKVYLAGAFGNYINSESARRIGLLKFPLEKIVPVGNSALLGAKLALFRSGAQKDDYSELLHHSTHISLNTAADFQDIFADEMLFP